MLKAIIASLKTWYVGALKTGGYWVVALMMAIESSVFPLPSEIVIPPAAYWAHTNQIPLSLTGLVIAGTIGSWLGATAMYWAARLAGRPVVMRYGRYVMISPAKVEGAERWAAHYGSMGIFISRLLPVVRHLIGIPAGIVRMSYKSFSLYTLLGSGIWCGVLLLDRHQGGKRREANERRDACGHALAGGRHARARLAVLLLCPSPHESGDKPASGAGAD